MDARRVHRRIIGVFVTLATFPSTAYGQQVSDYVRQRQFAAIESGQAAWGHWGAKPDRYSDWTNHSNRLIPVYTFGIALDSISGTNSVYRSEERLRTLYGMVPHDTLNPEAEYFDQSQIHDLQAAAVAAGKKYVFLVIFDGMDWQTSHAAATYRARREAYTSGRGTGLHFLDYRAPENGFGFMVTSPATDRFKLDVDSQTCSNDDDRLGGYDWKLGGTTPWSQEVVAEYLLGTYRSQPHVVTDSASSATSMTCGIKTYNAAINVDTAGKQVVPLARQWQQSHGFSIGVVTSVTIAHATPAAAYANNVSRDDYQDLCRDLVGLSSVAHRQEPLPGVDVLLGAGWGDEKGEEPRQGLNFVAGNRHISADDLDAIDHRHGGRYEVVVRTPQTNGADLLCQGADRAIAGNYRLFGMFGHETGHLPYQTADGDYQPTRGAKKAERYSAADLQENPTLADMTTAAIRVLEARQTPFWLMVEAGDVDWANHDNNIDDSIGAVFSGDDAFKVITDWVDAHDLWKETAVIVTADHGHYFTLRDATALLPADQPQASGR